MTTQQLIFLLLLDLPPELVLIMIKLDNPPRLLLLVIIPLQVREQRCQGRAQAEAQDQEGGQGRAGGGHRGAEERAARRVPCVAICTDSPLHVDDHPQTYLSPPSRSFASSCTHYDQT